MLHVAIPSISKTGGGRVPQEGLQRSIQSGLVWDRAPAVQRRLQGEVAISPLLAQREVHIHVSEHCSSINMTGKLAWSVYVDLTQFSNIGFVFA
jgi:hypothetical protein